MQNTLQTSVWILSSNFIPISLYLFLFCTLSNMIFLFQTLFRLKVPRRSEHLTTLAIISARPAVNPETRQRSSCVTYQLVLVGCDGREDGLHKHEGSELLRLEVEQRGRVVLLLDDVDPGLVLVHGVEDNLKNHNPKHQPGEFRSLWILCFYPHLENLNFTLKYFCYTKAGNILLNVKLEILNFWFIFQENLWKNIFFLHDDLHL